MRTRRLTTRSVMPKATNGLTIAVTYGSGLIDEMMAIFRIPYARQRLPNGRESSTRMMSWKAFRRLPARDTFQSSLRAIAAAMLFAGMAANAQTFRFAILGDRTGGAVAGVFEEAWREVNADHPDFVINVGDTIQGGDDTSLAAEWRQISKLMTPYRRYRMFYVPGNHDVWSDASGSAYEKFTGRPLHYSFDYEQAHFTVLDNSRTEQLDPGEIAFLKADLEAHSKQPVKFIFFHRPFWIVKVLLQDPDFPLHRLAKQYGVQYVICGHIHEMLHLELDGVTYLSMASSGGHLRNPKTYEKGWFFEHSLATVRGNQVDIKIKELAAPFGRSRTTSPNDWGAAGLAEK